MPRPSNRQHLLEAGLCMVHERGFVAASVRDIVRAAGVPQGSFTNHWPSKEAFALDVLDAYSDAVDGLAAGTLRAANRPALDRMRAFVAVLRQDVCGADFSRGCLLGNASAECGGDAGSAIRLRVVEILCALSRDIERCLADAVADGDLCGATPCGALAGAILSFLQGAILMAKAQRSAEPLDQMERFLFTTVLRRAEHPVPAPGG